MELIKPVKKWNTVYNSIRTVANDVRGGVVPNSSHWIPKERPDFLIKMLENFFGGNTTNTSKYNSGIIRYF
ncbi:MAG: hypothetical protein WAM14_08795 [Candidatus Nitrosopolaris sp.]